MPRKRMTTEEFNAAWWRKPKPKTAAPKVRIKLQKQVAVSPVAPSANKSSEKMTQRLRQDCTPADNFVIAVFEDLYVTMNALSSTPGVSNWECPASIYDTAEDRPKVEAYMRQCWKALIDYLLHAREPA
jgi:hypothetical protein